MKTAVELLHHVAGLVGGERAVQHGDKLVTHDNIARLWNAYLANLGVPAALTGSDVAKMMALLKIARAQNGAFNPDDYADLAGYAAVAFECVVLELARYRDSK